MNVKTESISNKNGTFIFEPLSGQGTYYIYYLASKNSGSPNYPTVHYLQPEQTASNEWLGAIPEALKINTTVKEIESINAFNSFYPMEVIATGAESAALIRKYKRTDYVVFPEDRQYPVKMFDRIPYRWVQRGAVTQFTGSALRGENYALQLNVYALQNLEQLSVSFADLKDAKGNVIAAKNLSCINTGGTDYKGNPFTKIVNVTKDSIQPLWCLLDVPATAKPGIYKGAATVKAANAAVTVVPIQLTVGNALAKNGNIAEPWKQTRLKWLNSTMAQENTVIAPYTPLVLKDNTIDLLGRKVAIAPSGFPAQISTFFNEEMTGLQSAPNLLLTEPIHFHFLVPMEKS